MSKNVKNIEKVLKSIKKFGIDAEKTIDDITGANALEIAKNSKQRVPKDKGKLAQSIYSNKEAEMFYSIIVGLEYGAYVEFGTGKQVQVPSELKELASSFKGEKGSFKDGLESIEDGLESIKDWCRSKGIDEKAAYPIFMSILDKGLTPQPYLYPSLVQGREQYLKDLKEYLKELTNKYNK